MSTTIWHFRNLRTHSVDSLQPAAIQMRNALEEKTKTDLLNSFMSEIIDVSEVIGQD